MTTFIQGVNLFPDEFPELDDGVGEQASNWNPALESLANRTKYLKLKVLAVPALNLHNAVSTTFNLARFVFSEIEQTWYGVWWDPGTDQLERSQDNGRTFTDLSAALGAGAKPCYDIACNQSNGNLTIINLSRDVYHGTLAGYGSLDTGANWAVKANAIAATPSTASVDWDDTHAKIITVYRTGATGFKAEFWNETAPTFTPATTVPAAWTGYTGSNDGEVACSSGQPTCTAIACFFDAGVGVHKLNVMRSTDGGANWTNQQKTCTGDYLLVSKPAYNKANNRWYLAGSTSLPVTEVWESVDAGVTWTAVATINGWKCEGIVSVGDLLVLLGEDQRLAYSLDRGVNWYFSTRALPNGAPTTMFLRAGGGGILIMNKVQKQAWTSLRVGFEGTKVST